MQGRDGIVEALFCRPIPGEYRGRRSAAATIDWTPLRGVSSLVDLAGRFRSAQPGRVAGPPCAGARPWVATARPPGSPGSLAWPSLPSQPARPRAAAIQPEAEAAHG